MQKLAFGVGLLALVAIARADDMNAAAPAASNDAIFMVPGDVKWTDIPNRKGTYMALAEGDPDKGPAHFLLKYDKGFAGGLHHHTNDHGGWILSGTVILVVDGVETKLPPGSFYFLKGKKPHIAKCDPSADCVMTVDVRGKWDVVSDPAPARK